MPELLATLAAEPLVDDVERRVGMLPALQQSHAAQRGFGIVAGKPHEQLAPGQAFAVDQREALEGHVRAEVGHERIDADRAGLRTGDGGRMPHLGAVADLEDQRAVGLTATAAAAQARFRHPNLGAGADDDERAEEAGGRRLHRGGVDDLDGLDEFGARRHLDHHAVLHHGHVEREDGVTLAETAGGEQVDQLRPSLSENIGQRAHGGALRQRVGQRRHEGPIDDDEPAAAEVRAPGQLLVEGAERGLLRLGRERKRVAHHRAQVRVMPCLDAAMRQAGGGEGAEGFLAQVANGLGAGQLALGRAIGVGQGHLGIGAGGDDACRHEAHSAAVFVTRSRLVTKSP